jgi:hypothetical protein
MNWDKTALLQIISQTLSENSNYRNAAEKQLQIWEALPGFCTILFVLSSTLTANH